MVDAARDVWRAVTPLGRSVGAAGLVCWAVAVGLGWEELSIVAAACLLALMVGVVFLLFGKADLAVVLDLTTPRVVVGDAAATSVEATNEADHRMLPVRLEARVGGGLAHVDVPALGAGASHDEVFVIPTSRRSVVPVGPVRSVQGDPLGLVRRERIWTGTEQLYVHPRTVRVSSMATGWMRDLEGETTNDRSPSDVAFHTLREYVVGDDRRHIHWRTTARQADGKLMVREFVDTRRAHLGLVMSVRLDDYGSDQEFELAVSVMASLGLRALGDDQEVTCLTGVRRAPSFHGTSFLDSLAGLEVGSDDASVVMAAARGRDAFRGVSVAAVISGSRCDPAELRAAAQRIGPSVHTVLIRAVSGSDSRLVASGGAPMLEVGSLDDLPRLVFAVAGR